MAGHMMYYTYVLESEVRPGVRYIGHTANLKQRLSAHNDGKCANTAKSRPWKLKLYIAFEDIAHARRFERYLKTGFGHAFASRHFW